MASIALSLDENNIDKDGKLYFIYDQIKDLPEFPEGPLIELYNGELYLPPSPSILHQQISGRLFQILTNTIKDKGVVLYAPVDVIFSDRFVTIPDLLVIAESNKSIIHDKFVSGSPDLIVEILSSNRTNDLEKKMKIYEDYKVKEYWIIDPVSKVLYKYVHNGIQYKERVEYSTEEEVSSIIFPNVIFQLSNIF